MVSFGQRRIGDGEPCFITFEAGPTHNGIESAKRLVTVAAEAGADAVKFQMMDPDRLVADRTLPFTYEVLVNRETGQTEEITESLYDILCRRVLSVTEWRQVKSHCDKAGVAFFATALFEDEIALLSELGCHSVKIASADVNHVPLIRKAAQSGMCLQIDTGNASIGEVESAVDLIRSEGNENIIIHHCPSGYPARLESINLRVISTLKYMFKYPIAYSDHTPGWEMDVAALALGVDLLEKTITEDRTARSIEHVMSLEPREAGDFVRMVRDIETALGNPRRVLHSAERERRKAVRRSIFLASDVRAGDRLGDVAVEFRRPGFGIPPDRHEELVDAVFRRDLPSGHCLSLPDLEWGSAD